MLQKGAMPVLLFHTYQPAPEMKAWRGEACTEWEAERQAGRRPVCHTLFKNSGGRGE